MLRKKWVVTAVFLLPLMTGLMAIVPKVDADCSNPGQTTNLILSDCFALNGTQKVRDVYGTPSVLVNLFVRLAFIGGGIILFFMVMYSGFLFISGGTKGAEQAKGIIGTAIVGFLVMFSAFWILQIVKLVTGTNLLGF